MIWGGFPSRVSLEFLAPYLEKDRRYEEPCKEPGPTLEDPEGTMVMVRLLGLPYGWTIQGLQPRYIYLSVRCVFLFLSEWPYSRPSSPTVVACENVFGRFSTLRDISVDLTQRSHPPTRSFSAVRREPEPKGSPDGLRR